MLMGSKNAKQNGSGKKFGKSVSGDKKQSPQGYRVVADPQSALDFKTLFKVTSSKPLFN